MTNIDTTPAQAKAIEAGGTNNVPVGNSLVKKGLFLDTRETGTEAPFRFVPIATVIEAEKEYAETIEREENETEAAGTSESWQIAQWNADDRERAIEALRAEFEDADGDRREDIRNELARMGTVVYPAGTPEHERYAAELRTELAKWSAETLDVSDAEQKFAEAVDTDDRDAQAEILDVLADRIVVTVPAAAELRDPNEKRYAHIEKWTDDALDVKEGILRSRLGRTRLLRADRMQAERHLRTVVGEIERRKNLA